jgi:hypothetical protein
MNRPIKNNLMDCTSKPRLVFFRRKNTERLPAFLQMHLAEQVTCLSETFHVTLIQQDCDYEKVCDLYRPDLTLFETGVNVTNCGRLKITRTNANSNVPKIGFVNADGWCETRSGTLSEVNEWGLEALFSVSATAIEHLPSMVDNLFIWPVFVDSDVFRNYGESKLIPVLLTGSMAPQYPWRNRVYKLVSDRYPSLTCPHNGYLSQSGPGQMLHGQLYARTINASLVVPACGTVAKEVVRKHFEIPACKACLITERSPALEAAGFVDMDNCVLADEYDIVDKLAYLFSHREEIERISVAGYELVHARHTLKHREQIAQWFQLRSCLGADQRIIQSGPFGSLSVVNACSATHSVYVRSNGLHLQLLADGDRKLKNGAYEEAEAAYLKCLGYMNAMPEPKLRVAVCELYRGNADAASTRLFALLEYTLAEYNAVDPDPVEWAYYIIALLCRGRVSNATERARQFLSLRHPELDRARIAVSMLTGKSAFTLCSNTSERKSVHQLTDRTVGEWMQQICVMLKACDQQKLADRLAQASSQTVEDPKLQVKPTASAIPSRVAGLLARNNLGAFGMQIACHKFQKRITRIYRTAIVHLAEVFTWRWRVPSRKQARRAKDSSQQGKPEITA